MLVGGAISPFTAELLPIENDYLAPNIENDHLEKIVEKNNSMILTLEHEWLHHCTVEVERGCHGHHLIHYKYDERSAAPPSC